MRQHVRNIGLWRRRRSQMPAVQQPASGAPTKPAGPAAWRISLADRMPVQWAALWTCLRTVSRVNVRLAVGLDSFGHSVNNLFLVITPSAVFGVARSEGRRSAPSLPFLSQFFKA